MERIIKHRSTRDIIQALVIDETITPVEALLLSRCNELWFYLPDHGTITSLDGTVVSVTKDEYNKLSRHKLLIFNINSEDYEIIKDI